MIDASTNSTGFRAAATGYILILTGALCFAGNNAFAVMSYQGGATPLTLITVRMIFALIALAILMRLTAAPIRLPKRERIAALGLGVLNGTMAFCLISSFEHVAIALAILVFYLYPMLTGIGAWLTGQEKLSPGLIVGLVGGFAGLALALDIRAGVADGLGLGLGLAFAAAILMTAVALFGARLMRTANSRAVTLHLHISAATLFLAASLAYGDWSFPTGARGWTGFGAVALCYTVAIATFFAGMARIGAVRASLLMNLEPVASIGLGVVLLGQFLDLHQLAGAALVSLSVTAVKWQGARRA